MCRNVQSVIHQSIRSWFGSIGLLLVSVALQAEHGDPPKLPLPPTDDLLVFVAPSASGH